MKNAVIGIASTYDQAENIVGELKAQGFVTSDVSVLFPDKKGTREFAHDKGTKAPEGALAGAGAGGVIGGTIGLLAGIGALAIPGLGPFIAAGPIMATLSGAAAGATVGGVVGTLVGLGIPEYQAKVYEGRLPRRQHPHRRAHRGWPGEGFRALHTLKRMGAHDVSSTGEVSPPKRKTG